MSRRFKMGEGDWVCSLPKCGNVNFARRDKCNRCGTPKPVESGHVKLTGGHEIGKNAAEKSGGLFSADDWQCKGCGNVNWARRSTCNICNAPKFGVEEVRTGLGGGFKENDDIEYVRRDDSDSEYDEFGRKKKKFRSKDTKQGTSEHNVASKTPSHAGSTNQTDENDDDEEEDEDEDEEEDVSKYNLEDDDDDEEDLAKYDLDEEEEEGSDKDSNKYHLDSDSYAAERKPVGELKMSKHKGEEAITSQAKRMKAAD